MTGDALRNTLDHLALDPNSGADRHYLVTMLRRLGYSDQEIRHVLGEEGEEERVIEVEYTGHGTTFLFGKPGKTRSFSVVEGKDGEQQFTLSSDEGVQQFTLVGDEEAGLETFEGVDLDDVDVSDDWGDWDDDGGQDVLTDDFAEDDGEADGPATERTVSFKEHGLVAFKTPENTGWTEVEAPGEWSDDEWAVDDAPADSWQPADDEPLQWEDADEADVADTWDEPAYTYQDYTLYTRPVELTTGKTQQIYFFAKDAPKSGHPSALPDGYEVGVSEKTGLPFLRKSTGAKPAASGARHDYLGDVHEVVDLEGIGPTYEKKLHDAGITNTQELLFTDDEELQDITGAPAKTVQNWKHMSQLLKINGIGPQFAELMVRAGIEGIEGLKEGDPEDMVAQVKEYESGLKTHVTGSGIGIKRMTDWHEQAKAMRKGPVHLDDVDVHDLESRAAIRDAGDGGHPKADDPADAGNPDPLNDAWREPEGEAWDAPTDGDGADPGWNEPNPLNDRHIPGHNPDARPTRVRVRRVAAEDAESARELVRREGGDVRGVVPIRIEEHDE